MRIYKQTKGSLNVSGKAKYDFLVTADIVSTQLAAAGHPISIDDVRKECDRLGIVAPHPRMWSSVFVPSLWERVGQIKATHEGAHSRRVTLWRLK